MSEPKPDKKPKIEQVALTERAAQKIDAWFLQMPGLDLSKREIVNWLIEKQPDEISNADISGLVDAFYSKEKFFQQLVRKAKQEKSDGVDREK